MRLLINSEGKLRAIWRAVIFFALGNWAIFPLLGRLSSMVETKLRMAQGLTPANVALSEIQNLCTGLICTGIFALYERRRVDSYGLPVQRALGERTWEGAAAGALMAGAVALGMLALGDMQIHGFATKGSTLALYALGWLGANVCVGIAEEFWYRSYLLQTLWKSLGVWPASIAIALVFAADHYFYKTGENIWDVITLASLSLLLCYSVLRTGTLWFAVGFHMAFDYVQLFVIGTPNGSRIPAGRLLDATFQGPAWLTGGVLGTEASFLMYPLIALAWIYVWWRFPGNEPNRAGLVQ